MFLRNQYFFLVLTFTFFTIPLFSQTFAAPKTYGPFTDTFQMKVGGFVRGDTADLIGVANFNGGKQTGIFFYRNNGNGSFSSPRQIANTTGAEAVEIGDFNHDGNLDFAFILYSTARVGVAYGNGKGNFSNPVFTNVNGIPDSIAIGDYDDDGRTDIATLSDATHAVTILRNTGSSFSTSSFAVPLYYSSNNTGFPPDSVGNLVSGDLTGNHHADLAFLDTCADSSCGPGLNRIYTLINTGNGKSFTPELVADEVPGTAGLQAADLDQDGKVDLLVWSSGPGFGSLWVEYSDGNGSFTRVSPDDSSLNAGLPEDLAVGDFNNDGVEDIAALTSLDQVGDNYTGFDLYTGKGGRSGFNAPTHFAYPSSVSPRGGFAAGFFDNGRTLDVALVAGNGLGVFLNTTPTSGDPCPYPSGSGLNNCLPRNNTSGTSPVHVLASYKATAQPALRIEFWVDGSKLFQEYGDLLNTSISLPSGKHRLSVVGVDATNKPFKSNTTYTVKSK